MPEQPVDEVTIDVAALERRYAEERTRRLRDAGMAQYQPLEGRFAALAADPHADPGFSRDAVMEDVEVGIVGGGFAGLLAGARLREAGVASIRLIERGADFGGTWYWNRYPGAACDVETAIYLPMMEEMGYVPRERYARASEIHAYCRLLAERFGLYPAALFQTEVRGIDWDEAAGRWIIATDRGDRIAARFVISAAGLLSRPKLPGIPGIESFDGHAFHTSRWDYAYTGGDESGGMTGLADKRVGIIGTGATAVQSIPHLAKSAGHLYVFQRTPASVDVRDNGPVDPATFAGLPPGWQRARRDNFTTLVGGGYAETDLVRDGWTDLIRQVAPRLEDGTLVADPDALKLAELTKMELVRRRVDAVVEDRATAEALKPYFHYFCKRPCFHDEYLPAFNRPNVTLVDTAGRGVERITPAGAVVGGIEYPLDCLVFATGFDFLTDYCREAGFEVTGPGGLRLSDHWRDGPRTLHGMHTNGFPNFFVMAIAQAGAAVNYVHTADEQIRTIVHVIAACRERGALRVQATREAQDAWVAEIVAGAEGRRAFLETCTPGYYSYEGKREPRAALNDFYAPGPMPYIDLLARWRADPSLPGLEITAASPPSG